MDASRFTQSDLSELPMPSTTPPDDTCDLLVVGSGAGALSTAVTAAHLGLKVIVVEKDAQYGGTTAWSGGWMWVPRNPLAVQAGLLERIEKPLSYLRRELGDKFDESRALAFLNNGPRMVQFFRRHTALQFIDGNAIPDFHGHTPDAALGGRSICAAPFDARQLGARLHDLKPPLHETTLWGMGIASGAELRHFLNALSKPSSFWIVSQLVLRHWRDLLVHRRGTRLVNGNALIGALAKSAFDLGVDIRVNSPAVRLLHGEGRVNGAVVQTPQGEQSIRARCGVVLATGGFPHDPARKQQLLPHAPTGHEHWSAGNRGNTGDGLRMGESAGGVVADDLVQAAALAPVSLVPRANPGSKRNQGSVAHFPHLIERAKPGLIAVNVQGQRFTNEANSYHDFMQGLLATTPAGQAPEAWLVCDHAFIRYYGLGAVKPAPMLLSPWLKNGYLKRGHNLTELAKNCGINAQALQATVQRYNALAQDGKDRDFGKGETPYNRIQGDAIRAARHGLRNPCMGPITQGPFYAVKVVMGSLGTFAGLRVNDHAQVIDAHGQAIAGLYAGGNDLSSMMGGHYPAGGITLGPAMTFGFVAAHHAAGREPSATCEFPVSKHIHQHPERQHHVLRTRHHDFALWNRRPSRHPGAGFCLGPRSTRRTAGLLVHRHRRAQPDGRAARLCHARRFASRTRSHAKTQQPLWLRRDFPDTGAAQLQRLPLDEARAPQRRIGHHGSGVRNPHLWHSNRRRSAHHRPVGTVRARTRQTLALRRGHGRTGRPTAFHQHLGL